MNPNPIPNEKEVSALLTFLADPSEQTVALAKDHLRRILQRHPAYKHLLKNSPDPAIAARAHVFLEETRLEELKNAFQKLAAQGRDLDLEQGTILLAQSAYPTLDPTTVSRALDRLAEGVEKDLENEEASATREAIIMRRHLFDRLGFMGNEQHYYDPDNSYIHRVLERKLGIPISLSCVYLFVAKRLDIPAYGVGLPGHFIIGHDTPNGILYIDPFHRGRILTRSDCVEILRQRRLAFQDAFLSPTPNHQVLTRTIANLINLYTDEQQPSVSLEYLQQGQPERAQWLMQILALFENG
jgi:regulator of sirC expression with transglutaminase-like and TPR domain